MSEQEMQTVINDADNESLKEIMIEIVTFGSEVNGFAVIRRKFFPTRQELLDSVEYWYWETVGMRWWFGSAYPAISLARRRISRIASILGDASVDEVIKDTEEELLRRVDPELWKDFDERFQKRDGPLERLVTLCAA